MTNWYQSRYEATMEESVRKAEATLQQFRCMAMANQESSTNWGAKLANLRANSANFVANGANLGVSMVNFGYPPPNSPLSSSKFPPPMSNHYGGPLPTSTNYEGHQTNDMSADSFLRSQTESFYQDPRDETFSMGSDSSSAMADRKLPSSNFQFETPMSGNSNFGRALASDLGATMAEKESFSSAWRLKSEESNRRFYRKLNDVRIEFGMPPVMDSCDPVMNQVYDRSIFVKIHKEFYSISCEVLYTVFSRYGILDRVERLSEGFHSTICFQHKESTLGAFEFLNGMNLYDDCCQLELFLAKEPTECSKSQSDTTFRDESVGIQEVVTPSIISSGELNSAIPEEIEVEAPIEVQSQGFDLNQQIVEVQISIDSELRVQSDFSETLATREIDKFAHDSPKQNLETSRIDEKKKQRTEFIVVDKVQELQKEIETSTQVPTLTELQIQYESSKVKFDSQYSIYDDAIERKIDVESPIISDGILEKMIGSGKFSIGFLETSIAYKVFVEMPRKVQVRTGIRDGDVDRSADVGLIPMSEYSLSYHLVFDPGGGLDCEASGDRFIDIEISSDQQGCISFNGIAYYDIRLIKNGQNSLPFDRGRVAIDIVESQEGSKVVSLNYVMGSDVSKVIRRVCIHLLLSKIIAMPLDNGRVDAFQVGKQGLVCILVFDPGGSCCQDILGPCIS